MTHSLPTSLRVTLWCLFRVDGSNVLSGGSGDDSLSASIEIASDPVSLIPFHGLNLSNTLDGGTGNDHLEASINMVNSHEGPQWRWKIIWRAARAMTSF